MALRKTEQTKLQLACLYSTFDKRKMLKSQNINEITPESNMGSLMETYFGTQPKKLEQKTNQCLHDFFQQ